MSGDYIDNDSPLPKETEVCVVKSVGRYGYQSIYKRSEAEEPTNCDMTRVSEFIKVIFVPRRPEDIIPEMVSKIDLEIQSLRVSHEERLQSLYRRRQDLLALTYQSPPEPRPTADFEDDIPF